MNLLSSLLKFTADKLGALISSTTSLDSRLTTAEDDIDSLEAQFTTVVSAVTTDTEVTNIRVGDDGVTYDTAGNAVRKQFSDVKSDFSEFSYGEYEFLKGTFVNGGLSSGNLNTSQKYRVTENEIISYDKAIKLIIASGYKVGVHTFVSGSFSADSGWQTGSYVIPANTDFKLVIAKTTEDTSSVADVRAFKSTIKIQSIIDVHTEAIDAIRNDATGTVNLFNPKDLFMTTNNSGVKQNNAYFINNDGTINAYGSNANYGQRFLASMDSSKQFSAGTYTISGKVTIDASATDCSRELVVMIGYGTAVFVPITTERGGNTQIANSAKSGYFRRTVTLDSASDFAFEVWSRNSQMSTGSMPIVISEFMIEKSAELHEYTSALYTANDKPARSILENIATEYNWYNPTTGYSQTNKDGTAKDGYTINADGSITCTRALNGYGSLFLVDASKQLKAGKYTISGKITLDQNVPNGMRSVALGIGRSADYSYVDLTTTRNGTSVIADSDKEGWFASTITIPSNETFAVMAMMRYTEVASASLPYTISNLQIEAGEYVTDYTSNAYQSKDVYARTLGTKAIELADPTSLRERTFNASYHTGAADFATKCESFSNLLLGDSINDVDAPTDFETFLFFTDPHLTEFSGWEDKCYEFISQIQKYYNSTPTSFCLCGGDWLGNSDLPSTACFKMGYIDGFMHSMFDNCHMLVGNHDTNYQGKKDESSATWTTRLSNQSIADLWFRKENKTYYSFNGANTKFYCFDSGEELQGLEDHDNYGYEQVAWFANSLLSDDSEHIALAVHIIYYAYDSEDLSSGIQPLTSAILQIAEAYNNRTSITFNGVTYNYSGRSGKVEFLIGGHYHNDVTGTLNGIPFVMTANVRKNESLGATFDLVLADYGNNVMKLIRVGSGSNRTISL